MHEGSLLLESKKKHENKLPTEVRGNRISKNNDLKNITNNNYY